jgi:ZIP family zinc transporter
MWAEALIWGLISTCPLAIGAYISLHFRPSAKALGIVMGFGAGALISAVAYELIPGYSPGQIGLFLALGLGAVVFYVGSALIDRRSPADGRKADANAQAGKALILGALLDGLPESLVLGISVAVGDAMNVAFLGAVFVSNLPESIAATAEMDRGGVPRRRIYAMWAVVMLACVAFVLLGAALLQLVPGTEGIYFSAFAAGAVLMVLADSMIPEGFAEGGRPTGLMVVLGFAFASVLAFMG